eukprot:184840-Chlamydomonas_euryale.AAC.2
MRACVNKPNLQPHIHTAMRAPTHASTQPCGHASTNQACSLTSTQPCVHPHMRPHIHVAMRQQTKPAASLRIQPRIYRHMPNPKRHLNWRNPGSHCCVVAPAVRVPGLARPAEAGASQRGRQGAVSCLTGAGYQPGSCAVGQDAAAIG